MKCLVTLVGRAVDSVFVGRGVVAFSLVPLVCLVGPDFVIDSTDKDFDAQTPRLLGSVVAHRHQPQALALRLDPGEAGHFAVDLG